MPASTPCARLGGVAAVAFAVGALQAPALLAQTHAVPTDGSAVSLELIMSDPDWIGRAPERPWWSPDGREVYFWRERAGETVDDLYRIPTPTEGEPGEPELVPIERHSEIPSSRGHFDRGRRHYVWTFEGDLWIRELDPDPSVRQLTRTATLEQALGFVDGPAVSFRRDAQIFVRDLDSGLELQPFDLRFEEDPEARRREERKKGGYLWRQQTRLFDMVREQERREELERNERERALREDPDRSDPPWYLGDDVEATEMALSPDTRWLALAVAPEPRDEGRNDSMPRWVTQSGYVEPTEVRVKVGTAKPWSERLWLLDSVTHEQLEIDLSALPGILDDPLADLRAAAEEREKEQQRTEQSDSTSTSRDDTVPDDETEAADSDDADEAAENAEEKEPRPVRLSRLEWSPDGRFLAGMAFSRDNKDRWLFVVEPSSDDRADTGDDDRSLALRALHRLHDPAWINWTFNEWDWLPDSRRLWLLSEESGYSHIYTVAADGSAGPDEDDETAEALAITGGSWVANDVEVTPDGRFFVFRANVEHPGRYESYRIPTDGGLQERISDHGGGLEPELDPTGRRLLYLGSSSDRPEELFLQELRPGAEARRLTTTISDAFARRPWVKPRIVEVPSSHTASAIQARLYLPESEATSNERRPAVVFVHGAGYLQNAHLGWSSYFREFMFHTFLVQHGYVVLDMDYRASAGYGRDWRTAIYRRMGTPELEDLRDGVEWLVQHHDVDRDRVGVYGGSYGGFLTLMALFREPDLFAVGAALRPVTDWAHYNHPYTSNILNTPALDPEAYERSSPIEFADGLAAPLLMCSGMLDDNVFFQDSVRLVQRLIELEKEDWEMAIYPIEPHGFREPSSWLDEYRRIFKLFERELRSR